MPRFDQTVVLGAGLQGACIALELARRGQRVILLDQDERPMNRASLRNEGKIHLGLVYAKDPSLNTASLMMEGALSFHPLLSRWLGSAMKDLHYSTRFNYVVANDSLLNPDQLTQHYASVESIYHRILNEKPHVNYLGQRPAHLYRRMSDKELAAHFSPSKLLGGFETVELAVDTDMMATLVRQAIENEPNIEFFPSRTVKAVERHINGFRIEGESPNGNWNIHAEQVVNATWANRLAIDRTVGLNTESNWLHRLKYRVIAHLPDELHGAPSATMVIGRYGDVVIRPDGTVYLSWYPAALKGWCDDLIPPASWQDASTGNVEANEANNIAREFLHAIDAWYPGIAKSEPFQVDAGVIFAHGETDVDDNASGLHDRTNIGVTSVDGYHSVSTGKLTTAPLFAEQAAALVMPGVDA